MKNYEFLLSEQEVITIREALIELKLNLSVRNIKINGEWKSIQMSEKEFLSSPHVEEGRKQNYKKVCILLDDFKNKIK